MKSIVVSCMIVLALAVGSFAQLAIHRGTIDSIRPESRIIVIRDTAISRAFVVSDNAEIILKDRSSTKFEDLAVGQSVEVGYRTVDGVDTAYRVTEVGLKAP